MSKHVAGMPVAQVLCILVFGYCVTASDSQEYNIGKCRFFTCALNVVGTRTVYNK